MRHARARPIVLAGTIALAVAACAETAPSGSAVSAVLVDTLATGTIVVENRGGGDWPARRPLVEVLRVGSPEAGPDGFGVVTAVAFDALGRLWVLDGQANDIRVFERTGGHVRTIGREGEGPGEFRGPAGMWHDGNGVMWVADMGNQRYTALDTAGTVLRERPRTVLGRLAPAGPRPSPDGSFLDAGAGIWGRLSTPTAFRLGPDLAKTDSLTLAPLDLDFDDRYFDLGDDAPFYIQGPWIGDHVWAPGTDGRIWLAHSRRYRLDLVTMSGDTVLRVIREAEPLPVTARELADVLARYDSISGQAISAQAGRVPDTKPFFRELIASDTGDLWVVREKPYQAPGTRFDVFAPDGRLRGSAVSATPLLPPFRVVGDRLLATTRDDLDVPYVVVLSLQSEE